MLKGKRYNIILLVLSSLLFLAFGIGAESLFYLYISFILLGIAIFSMEYRLGFLAPFSPGFMFWVGYLLSYFVGYLLCDQWYYNSKYGFSNIVYEFTLLILAMEFFALGIALGYRWGFSKGENGGRVNDWDYTYYTGKLRTLARLNTQKVLKLCIIISAPFLLFMLTHPGYFVDLPVTPTPSYNLIVGLTRHVVNVAFAILLLYFVKERREPKNVRILLLIILMITSVMNLSRAIVYGGREPLLLVSLSWYLFYFGLCLRGKRIAKPLYLALFLGIVGMSYIAIMGVYRVEAGYSGGRARMSKTEALKYAADRVAEDVKKSLRNTVGDRIFEESGLFIISLRRQTGKNFGFKGFENFLLQYIPKAIYKEKGSNRGNDILWFEGYRKFENTFAPITLLGDAFYRFGLVGVMVVFFLYGVLISKVCAKLWKNVMGKNSLLSFVLLAVLCKYLVRAYSQDIIGALELITYEIPIVYIFSYVVLKKLGIAPRRWRLLRSVPAPRMNAQ